MAITISLVGYRSAVNFALCAVEIYAAYQTIWYQTNFLMLERHYSKLTATRAAEQLG